nr:hypothetical protein 7 [Gammaproteobacteria bacterium]
MALAFNLDDARQFLTLLSGESNHKETFQVFTDNKDNLPGSGVDPLAGQHHGTLDEVQEELTKQNLRGAGVFVLANAGTGSGTSKDDVSGVRAVFADDDDVRSDGPRTDWPLMPHVVVESSFGKYHYWWLTQLGALTLEEFVLIQKEIAQQYGTDKAVHNVNRVMRSPGFYHHKENEPFQTRIVEISPDLPRYTRAQIHKAFPQHNRTQKHNKEHGEYVEGERNSSLFKELCALRGSREYSDEEICEAAHMLNSTRCKPPLGEGELGRVVDQVLKYDAKGTDFAVPDDILLLPCHDVSFTESAQRIFPRFAQKRLLFVRGTTVVEPVKTAKGVGLEIVKADAFRARLDMLGKTFAIVNHNKNNALKERRCSKDSANALLETKEARELLPPIRLVCKSPILVPDGDSIKILKPNYNPEAGGVLVTGKVIAEEVPLDEAVPALLALFDGFNFQAPSDKSRAIAQMLTPPLRMGGFITSPCPVHIAEADQSQAGKGYLQQVQRAPLGEEAYLVTKREGGVGSVDESLSSALLSGKPFVALDNLRGRLDSQTLEAAITWPDHVSVRVPHKGEMQVDVRAVTFTITSNGVETTVDLANRSCIVRIQKQPQGFAWTSYPEGSVLEHVKAHQGFYLGCVFSVVREWVKADSPKTNENRHSMRQWAGTLDWIVQNVFGLTPLMDDHQGAQQRVSDTVLVWLRAVCLAAQRGGMLGQELSASRLYEVSEDEGLSLPRARTDMDETKAVQHIGRVLGKLFREAGGSVIEVEGFTVTRNEYEEYSESDQRYRKVKRYTVSLSGDESQGREF